MSLNLPELPVSTVLPELCARLSDHADVVLQAPTGAGKTTRVPLALLDAPWLAGQKILLLEPRRLAARAAARRMAAELGEPVGQRVGYRVQLESKISAATQIEVVTEGILLRQLQADPELTGVGLIIFDEFHERSLAADLGLVLSAQSQQFYRDEPPLKRLLMSATLDTAALGDFLQAPVVISAGRSFPVTVHYRERPLASLHPADVCQAAAETARRALAAHQGSILLFLPGVGEIRRTAELLQDLPADVDLAPLYGDLSAAEQDRAIQPAAPGRRKLVLATAIAESSLTIEGVEVVIDAGLMRQPQFDPRSGLTRLETLRVSRAAAEQRRGRAGRLAPGVCYRLWTESQQQQLQERTAPEILGADLAPLVLQLYAWGARGADEFEWLDSPPQAAWARGQELLLQLGALAERAEGEYRLTAVGEQMAELGLHPRLARMLLGAGADQALACDLAALLQERDLLSFPRGQEHADLLLRVQALAGNVIAGARVHRGTLQRVRQHSRQLQRRLGCTPAQREVDTELVASLLLWAYPDRVAQRRGQSYQLAGGQGAMLDDCDPLAEQDWLMVASLGGRREQSSARIFLACPLQRAQLQAQLADRLGWREELAWDAARERVRAEEVLRLGALCLERRPLTDPDPELIERCLLQELARRGLQVLNWTAAARQLQERMSFMHGLNEALDTPFPDCSERGLTERLALWLGPFASGCRSIEQLARIDLTAALLAQLDWSQQQQLERWAPRTLAVPSGSQIRIDYGDPRQPVLAARLQELFGLIETPCIAEGRVPLLLHLLSPARRPVQVTQDLASFWGTTYAQVKKDLKGRYPKHYWPDDPFTATATRHVRPR